MWTIYGEVQWFYLSEVMTPSLPFTQHAYQTISPGNHFLIVRKNIQDEKTGKKQLQWWHVGDHDDDDNDGIQDNPENTEKLLLWILVEIRQSVNRKFVVLEATK